MPERTPQEEALTQWNGVILAMGQVGSCLSREPVDLKEKTPHFEAGNGGSNAVSSTNLFIHSQTPTIGQLH